MKEEKKRTLAFFGDETWQLAKVMKTYIILKYIKVIVSDTSALRLFYMTKDEFMRPDGSAVL